MGFATIHGVNQEALGKGIFEIPGERRGTALRALLDIFIEHERFQSE
jgi:hypothetical protein